MTAKETAAFCMEISMLLEAGIPLDQGLTTMAEDAPSEENKKMLTQMSEEIELGMPFAEALGKAKAFPSYVISMARVGHETGTMDKVMYALSDYYNKEHQMSKSIKNALTYPIFMVFILVVVFFVLLTKVMPIFEGIYEQVGAQLSEVAKTAVNIGGILCGAIIVILLVMGAIAGFVAIMAKRGRNFGWSENLVSYIKEHSGIAMVIAKRRFTAVMSLTISSGLTIDNGLEMTLDLLKQKKSMDMVALCRTNFDEGRDFYRAIKETGMFNGMDLQMLKVGNAAGKLDATMEQLSERFEQQVDDAIDNMIGKFEPTIVAILAIAVGMILFSVMMPLIGIMSTIG